MICNLRFVLQEKLKLRLLKNIETFEFAINTDI